MILIIDGPNLNMLEHRDPKVYGNKSLKQIREALTGIAICQEERLWFFQSNHEGDIIDQIHEAIRQNITGIIINPGAFSHYSYAIRDALEMCDFPVVEVHLSDIKDREEFRNKLVTGEVCNKIVSGYGFESYEIGLKYILDQKKSCAI